MLERHDLIMDMIAEMGEFLRRALLSAKRGEVEQAEDQIEQASRALVGASLWQLEMHPMSRLPELLGRDDGYDVTRAAFAAQLLLELGELRHTSERRVAAEMLWERSAAFFDLAWSGEAFVAEAHLRERLVALHRRLPATASPEAQQHLLSALEKAGEFALAEDRIFSLAELDVAFARPWGASFYERLMQLPNEALEAGGLPRKEVADGLDALSSLVEGVT